VPVAMFWHQPAGAVGIDGGPGFAQAVWPAWIRCHVPGKGSAGFWRIQQNPARSIGGPPGTRGFGHWSAVVHCQLPLIQQYPDEGAAPRPPKLPKPLIRSMKRSLTRDSVKP
jgi:hypothetical protein